MPNLVIIGLITLILIFSYWYYSSIEGYKPSDPGYGLPDVDVPSFKEHIAPLFRPYDIVSMKWKFDLSNYEEVKIYAEPIYRVVKGKKMPCDKPWNDDYIALFKKWMDTGMMP